MRNRNIRLNRRIRPNPHIRYLLGLSLAIAAAFAQQPRSSPGAAAYQSRCVLCHGGDGSGSDRAPAILDYLAANPPEQIATLILNGVPNKGMPAFEMPEGELAQLVSYLQTLGGSAHPGAQTARAPSENRPRRGGVPGEHRPGEGPLSRPGRVTLADGSTLEGTILNESGFDLQLRTSDGKIHLLVRQGEAYHERVLEPKRDWLSYHGNFNGNRHSPLDEINAANVARLAPRWFFPISDVRFVEGTPAVADGILYLTSVNQVYALDAASGREIWRYSRPRSEGVMGDAGIGLNRGVSLAGDRLFTVTDNAHLIALDRFTGGLLWDTEMADSSDHYGGTAAPLVVGDLVIAGISGGDTGLRGFLDAYHVSTGERAWRFWTIPAPGEPGSETWANEGTAGPDPKILERGCGATWLTGSYDPGLDLLYWPTGNPCPDMNGDVRPGDNLYTDSVVALKPTTGQLQWHFQFTPHDTHDWDAEEPLLLIDEPFQGRPRKLLVQANRNGFLYVLDRTTGEFLLSEPFAHQTWAKGIDPTGRPIVNPESTPTVEGTLTCPAIRGATNWMSTAYHPGTKLFYLLVHESCNIYSKEPEHQPWQRGRGYMGGSFRLAPNTANQKFIRALDIQTGKTVWDYPQTGTRQTYSGVLSTAGGLVFFGEDSGAIAALDAATGRLLWHLQLNQDWKASPMTYMVGGKQYVAIGGLSGFWAFALP
jgi:alcohol dehydrogenase (cytochrome c)